MKDQQFSALDANSFASIPDEFRFEWPSIEAIGEILVIFHEAARSANLHVYARTYNMAKCFRQLGAAPFELWKTVTYTEEGYRYDRRVQMGRTIAAHHGHRLSLLIGEIIEERAELEDWTGIFTLNTKLTENQRHALRRRIERCRDRLQEMRKNSRLFSVTPFQGDLVVLALGRRAAKITEQQIPTIMNELGIKLSENEEANKPFDRRFQALVAQFD